VERTVLVAGGGLSGLAAAWRLLAAGLDVELVEGAERLGGTLGSEVVDGFVFERGPSGFQDNVPETLDLAREVGLEIRLCASSPGARKRYLLRGGRLRALGPATIFFSGLLPLRARLRLLLEPFCSGPRPGESDESVAAFGRRRLGAAATAAFLDPVVTGVYAGDVERISVVSGFPRLARLEREHGSIVRGLLRARRERTAGGGGAAGGGAAGWRRAAPALWTFQGGLEELVGALAARLGARARVGASLERIEWRRDGGGFRVVLVGAREIASRALVLAVPAPRAAALVREGLEGHGGGQLAAALASIPYAPVAVVCLGYRRADVAHALDGFGFLAARAEGLRALGAIWVSSLFPAHAPEGAVSLRVLVGGAHDPEAAALPPAALEEIALRELTPLLGLRGAPVASRVYRYPLGIPQYEVGHAERVARIEGERRRFPGLFLTGNAYRGVGMNDCVRDGARVAREIASFLEAPRS
jgi:oxygen-dependent protoporphyrinogen oxidase